SPVRSTNGGTISIRRPTFASPLRELRDAHISPLTRHAFPRPLWAGAGGGVWRRQAPMTPASRFSSALRRANPSPLPPPTKVGGMDPVISEAYASPALRGRVGWVGSGAANTGLPAYSPARTFSYIWTYFWRSAGSISRRKIPRANRSWGEEMPMSFSRSGFTRSNDLRFE